MSSYIDTKQRACGQMFFKDWYSNDGLEKQKPD